MGKVKQDAEYYRKYRKNNADKLNEQRRKWLAENDYPYREAGREYERLHPVKAKARLILHQAAKKGIIVKPDACEQCHTKGTVIGFRNDDRKALEVRWLCRRCFYYANKLKKEIESE